MIVTGRTTNESDLFVLQGEITSFGTSSTGGPAEVSVDGIWAIGNIAGNSMFKHFGDKEAEYVVENAVRGNEREVEYLGMIHAVFGSPQVGSLGQTEGEINDDVEYETGT